MLTVILSLLSIYIGIGFLAGIYFSVFGFTQLDPEAKKVTWGFRLIIFPSGMLLWPYWSIKIARTASNRIS